MHNRFVGAGMLLLALFAVGRVTRADLERTRVVVDESDCARRRIGADLDSPVHRIRSEQSLVADRPVRQPDDNAPDWIGAGSRYTQLRHFEIAVQAESECSVADHPVESSQSPDVCDGGIRDGAGVALRRSHICGVGPTVRTTVDCS